MKNILITGTSSGFGKEIAHRLISKGHNVVGTARNPEKLSDASYPILKLDVTKQAEVNSALDSFIQMNKKIDVLINNAGFGIAGAIEDTSMEEAKSQFDTNFFGVARMSKAALPYMRNEKGGLIINIGSIGGQIGLPFQGFYSASKHALEGFTEALRIEVRPFNINVVNLNPGDFKTNFTDNRQLSKIRSKEYEQKFTSALDRYIEDERNGSDPVILAALIERLINKENAYSVRYLVGDTMQKVGVKIKGILGSRAFEKLMISTYNQK